MNPIYTVQNNRVALSILNDLDRTRKRKGEDRPAPAIRFEISRKTQLAPGHYTIDRATTLAHNLSLAKARLLFHDIANGHFNEDYQVIFRDHPGSISDRASMLSATYRLYDEQHATRIILEVWDGPGTLDSKMGWVYPLNKDEHALAIILDLAEARQMALAVLAQIQVWETVAALREYGLIPPAAGTHAATVKPGQGGDINGVTSSLSSTPHPRPAAVRRVFRPVARTPAACPGRPGC